MEVVTAAMSDRVSVVTTIVLAFSTDPMARWCWPDAGEYLATMPLFIERSVAGRFNLTARIARATAVARLYGYRPGQARMRKKWGESRRNGCLAVSVMTYTD